MYYQLSNTAGRHSIEKELGLPFKYPNLHEPQPVVNGLEESILPVVTMGNSREINFAIWGILPENYKEDWAVFQNAYNTLTIEKDNCMKEGQWYSGAFRQRRCLVIASGFFTYYLNRGDLYPFYVHARDDRPFAIGGIYNRLEDGFITCAIIVAGANEQIRKVQNLDQGMPLVVEPSDHSLWLNKSASMDEIEDFICQTPHVALCAHPISKEFFNPEKRTDSILQPVHYQELA